MLHSDIVPQTRKDPPLVTDPPTMPGGIEWATTLQDGPDGTKWVGVQISVPFGAFVVAMPADQAQQLAAGLGKMIREAAKEAQRLNGGLTIVPADGLAALDKFRNNHKN